ncbi:hypothetical protein BAE44_0013409 [Dichanthelium oligosanthes]|uniref:Uncharacterized protein n=1 Tax=Dichanthelium oligosanthes TaxID=888268 RepID=A0A1E5VKH3_9POAL|nr:hypothetical protein BAE44_0013409 [Dichanthelium oligosanthes]
MSRSVASSRSAGERFGLDIDDFLDWAGRNGDRARGSGCYERDSFTMDSKDLAVMLMLDGCLLLFAVFLLRASVSEDQGPANLAREKEHQKEFSRLSADISLHMRQTRLDLLMLDNQIPFFVLAELHQPLRGTLFQNNNQSIQELALSCFDDIHPSGFKLWQEDEIRHRSGGLPHDAAGDGGGTEPAVHHFQHLFHLSRVPTGKHKVGVDSILPKEPESHLPSATELEESSTSFTHITFRAATLHQHCVPEDNAWYARRDEHPRPLHPWLQRKTDKEIVDFFKDMRDEYGDTLMPEDLLALCRNVTAHRRSKARRVMKRIRLQCFPRQTVTFFVIFGAIISIATLINTVHSMYRHYHPYCKGTSPSYGP